MNAKIKQGSNFIAAFLMRKKLEVSQRSVVRRIKLYLNSPRTRILIIALSNGLPAWQLYRLGRSK